MDLGLADSCFVVTGGSSGLGLGSAEALVAEGATVLLVGRDEAKARAAAARLGDDAGWLAADLADPDAASRIVAAALATGVPVRGALLSVGGPPAGTPTANSDEQWRGAFESVFLGPLRVARALVAQAPDLAALCWVLSSSAKSPIGGLAISNGLRPGLGMLVKDLADELGPRGVRVNAVLPGRIDTPRLQELESGAPDPAALRADLASRIPLRRYGQPEELGAVAAFLLSDRASYVTGSLVPVDGGSLRAL